VGIRAAGCLQENAELERLRHSTEVSVGSELACDREAAVARPRVTSRSSRVTVVGQPTPPASARQAPLLLYISTAP
jgi:hypothetical protein